MACALATVVVFACRLRLDHDEPLEPLPPVDELPWPEPPAPSPACTSVLDALADPEVEGATGSIAIEPSAVLEPVGVDLRIGVEIRLPDGERDYGAAGQVQLAAPGGGLAFLDVPPLSEGRTEVLARFETPGPHVIEASLDGAEPRSGSVGVFAYESRLPVWEIDIDPDDLATIMYSEDPYHDDTEVPIALRVGDEERAGEVRLHGGSSRGYRKKSLRIDLPDDTPLDGHSQLILRAEWNDKSMLRNWTAYRIIRTCTWLPVSDAEFVHVRVNGAFYGLMLHVERVDADFLAARGLGLGGTLVEADPASGYGTPGADLEPMPAADYPLVYQAQMGLHGLDEVVELIEGTLELNADYIEEGLRDAVRVDDALVYLAAMAAMQNQDHVRKNYYLYRDPFADDPRFMVLPWDLDLSLGHLWTEENDVLDERVFTDGSIWAGERVPEHGFYNDLPTRLWGVPALRARAKEILARVARTALDETLVGSWLDEAVCAAAPEMLADEGKRATDDELADRIDEIRRFVRERRAFVDAEVAP